MKKVFLLLIGLFCAGFCFADEYDDLIEILHNSSGYCYNPKEMSIEYFSYKGDTYKRQPCNLNMKEKTIIMAGGWSSGGLLNKNVLKQAYMFSEFKFSDGKLLSFYYYDKKYLFLGDKNIDQIIALVKEDSVKRFSQACGSYTDEWTGRIYLLSKTSEAFKLTIEYNEPDLHKTESIPLEFVNPFTLEGNGRKVELYTWNEGQFSITDIKTDVPSPYPPSPYEDDINYSGPHVSTFRYTPVKDLSTEGVIETELQYKRYTFYDKGANIVFYDNNLLRISQYLSKDNYKLKETIEGFRVYKDADGWKHIDSNSQKFLIIDGEFYNLAFNYQKNSFREDIEAQNKCLVDEGTNRNIKAVHASSTLKDKSHLYAAEEITDTFQDSAVFRWKKNNIPWVEGKIGDGIDEYLDIELNPYNKNMGVRLILVNGYVDPIRPYLFKQNNRVKTFLVETNTGYSKDLTFRDEVEFTFVDLPAGTTRIKLTIKDVYKGTKYDDTCLSAAYVKYIDLSER